MANKLYNTHTLPTKNVVGTKPHKCTWCGTEIKKGEQHHYWRSVGDGFTENRMHGGCLAIAIGIGEFIYKPFKNRKTTPKDVTPASPPNPQATDDSTCSANEANDAR